MLLLLSTTVLVEPSPLATTGVVVVAGMLVLMVWIDDVSRERLREILFLPIIRFLYRGIRTIKAVKLAPY